MIAKTHEDNLRAAKGWHQLDIPVGRSAMVEGPALTGNEVDRCRRLPAAATAKASQHVSEGLVAVLNDQPPHGKQGGFALAVDLNAALRPF